MLSENVGHFVIYVIAHGICTVVLFHNLFVLYIFYPNSCILAILANVSCLQYGFE